MSLSDEQFEFAKDVARLIAFATNNGYKITFGEVWRTPEQQALYVKQGRSKTMKSKHLDRLAVDFNFFKSGKLLSKFQELEPLGKYWESLTPKNKWGGYWQSFKDLPHFERRI